eukprot:scaffold27545_cov52-Phaeocystis_antarctica.AAC.1
MLVTLEVSKLSGWLNADAYYGGSKGGHVRYGTMCGTADGGDGVQRAVEGLTADWEQSRCGAHIEHLLHGCDAGGIPVGNVRIEVPQVREEPAHVGDGRDVPIGDGAALRSGVSRVSVVGLDLRYQGGLGREDTGRRRRARRRRRGRRRRGRRR